MSPCVFAIAAHPDDIEFGMAGTMLLLKRRGWSLHYMNTADGSCGSLTMDAATTAARRLKESKTAAARLGATFHPPIGQDLRIIYGAELLARLASVIRDVQPDVVLLPSLEDYMEDHTETARLGVTAVFCRAMPNFPTDPPQPPFSKPVTIYHAQPHGHRDAMNCFIKPEFLINVSDVIEEKVALLAEHSSQYDMLQQTQGVNEMLDTLREFNRIMGRMAEHCEFAEGWRRHNPLGLCDIHADLICEALKDAVRERRD